MPDASGLQQWPAHLTQPACHAHCTATAGCTKTVFTTLRPSVCRPRVGRPDCLLLSGGRAHYPGEPGAQKQQQVFSRELYVEAAGMHSVVLSLQPHMRVPANQLDIVLLPCHLTRLIGAHNPPNRRARTPPTGCWTWQAARPLAPPRSTTLWRSTRQASAAVCHVAFEYAILLLCGSSGLGVHAAGWQVGVLATPVEPVASVPLRPSYAPAVQRAAGSQHQGC